jgi:hypothetical protein
MSTFWDLMSRWRYPSMCRVYSPIITSARTSVAFSREKTLLGSLDW